MKLNDRIESTIQLDRINLDITLECGQAFRWNRVREGVWEGVLGDYPVELKQSGDTVIIGSVADPESIDAAVRMYLRAQDDMADIRNRLVVSDAMFSACLDEIGGLRLVKMDEWECLISYVLATCSNIPRIRKMIGTLSERYGNRLGECAFSFPSMESLRDASVEDLRRCGLGYRAEYVHAISSSLERRDIDEMGRMSYEDLRAGLKELPGIGDKVADCVSLFGFGRLESFPVDIWVRRSLSRLYGVTGSYERLRRFGMERFGDVAGYAQEYLFYNERTMAGRGRCMFSDERHQRLPFDHQTKPLC